MFLWFISWKLKKQHILYCTKTENHKKGNGECYFGKRNLTLVSGKYHYNMYGHGGNDTFDLGPQLSTVTGGERSDIYIIQSDGEKKLLITLQRMPNVT